MNEKSDIVFSLAVLCYRGEREILPFIQTIYDNLSLFSMPWELVLVANYWPEHQDPTPEIMNTFAKDKANVRVLAEPKAGDMGWDMRKGLDACSGTYIGIIDGDGQFPFEAIFSCYTRIISDPSIDFIKTYRVYRGDGIYRNMISSTYNTLFRVLFPKYKGYNDVNAKPKIFKRNAYEKMQLESTDWFTDAEIVLEALKNDLKIYEIPVKFDSLGGRKSFVKPAAIWEFLKHLLASRKKYGRLS